MKKLRGSKAQTQERIDDELRDDISRKKGHGKELEPTFRSAVEGLIGRDLSDVRVHAGTKADTWSRRLSAEAFTSGRDIFLRSGRSSPHSQRNLRIITHEIVHILSHDSGSNLRHFASLPAHPDERLASQMGDEIVKAISQNRVDKRGSIVNASVIEQVGTSRSSQPDNGGHRSIIYRRPEEVSGVRSSDPARDLPGVRSNALDYSKTRKFSYEDWSIAKEDLTDRTRDNLVTIAHNQLVLSRVPLELIVGLLANQSPERRETTILDLAEIVVNILVGWALRAHPISAIASTLLLDGVTDALKRASASGDPSEYRDGLRDAGLYRDEYSSPDGGRKSGEGELVGKMFDIHQSYEEWLDDVRRHGAWERLDRFRIPPKIRRIKEEKLRFELMSTAAANVGTAVRVPPRVPIGPTRVGECHPIYYDAIAGTDVPSSVVRGIMGEMSESWNYREAREFGRKLLRHELSRRGLEEAKGRMGLYSDFDSATIRCKIINVRRLLPRLRKGRGMRVFSPQSGSRMTPEMCQVRWAWGCPIVRAEPMPPSDMRASSVYGGWVRAKCIPLEPRVTLALAADGSVIKSWSKRYRMVDFPR